MKKTTIAAVAAVLATAGLAAASYPGQQYAGRAQVSIAQARSTAVRVAHGSIVSQELERERGGSGLRYSFDMKTPRGMREVGIDANTGRVLQNSPEKNEAGEKGETGK